MQQLDLKCAERANKIINEIIEAVKNKADKNKIENLITKSLGVLQEDGVYAFFIYLKASKEGNITQAIIQSLKKLLRDEIKLINKDDILQAIRKDLVEDIDRLFLAKQLLERTLVYARYRAKALEDRGEGE